MSLSVSSFPSPSAAHQGSKEEQVLGKGGHFKCNPCGTICSALTTEEAPIGAETLVVRQRPCTIWIKLKISPIVHLGRGSESIAVY